MTCISVSRVICPEAAVKTPEARRLQRNGLVKQLSVQQ